MLWPFHCTVLLGSTFHSHSSVLDQEHSLSCGSSLSTLTIHCIEMPSSCVLQHTEEMDGAKFAKLCRDSKLLSRNVTASDADLFFAKARPLNNVRLMYCN